MLYLWVKAFHIIAVVSWVAALLIYPRYKLHQLASKPGNELYDRMQKASGQLRRIILTPSMLATWIFGITMVTLNPSIASSKWLWVKLLLVLGITAIHGVFVGIGKKIDAGAAEVTDSKLRMLNEVPFILFAIITILVVVRPF
ncbi:hypothetical protein AB833_21235 [Chromatiales bacterium (ex Bugula neritina AB1)]|nr:hypothetical protein AB833_21235 [Chromatiales bacterium (ex Bugula neritina AB1)]